MPKNETAQHTIFDFEKWEQKLPDLKSAYHSNEPYPHIMLDDFMVPEAAKQAHDVFPSVKDEGWIHYVHFNEKKHGLNKVEMLPDYTQQVIKIFNSDRFISWLSELTGISGLMRDDMLEGGGLHQSLRDGFLNIHADFTSHPHRRSWRRRVNLLVYLNPDWKEEYGGFLELWTRDMKTRVQNIMPSFNRAVIFNTDKDSYHGLPDPIKCPEDDTRKSIALYYFTEENDYVKQSTDYRARPTDGAKSILIYLDKKALSVYSRLKSVLGINDDFVSKVLNIFSKKK